MNKYQPIQELSRQYLYSLGRKIASLRAANHLTQRQLAERAYISPSYLGKLESGIHVEGVSFEVLFRLAYALDIEFYQLFRLPYPVDEVGENRRPYIAKSRANRHLNYYL